MLRFLVGWVALARCSAFYWRYYTRRRCSPLYAICLHANTELDMRDVSAVMQIKKSSIIS